MSVWSDMYLPNDNVFLKMAGIIASIWAFPILWMEHKTAPVRVACMIIQLPWAILLIPLMLVFVVFGFMGMIVEVFQESA